MLVCVSLCLWGTTESNRALCQKLDIWRGKSTVYIYVCISISDLSHSPSSLSSRYPLPESLNGAVLAFVFNLAALIMLFVAPFLPVSWMNAIMSGDIVVCAVAVLAVRETYQRWNAGEVVTEPKPQAASAAEGWSEGRMESKALLNLQQA